MTAIELSFKVSQINDVDEGIAAIKNSYMRHNIMVDVNYYARKTWNLANEYRLISNFLIINLICTIYQILMKPLTRVRAGISKINCTIT